MGEITVNLSDEMIMKIDQKMKKVNGDSIGVQVEMLLEPWINLVKEDTPGSEEKNVEDKIEKVFPIKQEKYVVKDGEAYALQYNKGLRDNKSPKHLTVRSDDLDKLNKFSLHMQKCNWDREEFKKLKEKLFTKRNDLKNIYNRNKKPNKYHVQFGVKDKSFVYGYDLTIEDAKKIRDYIKSLDNETKIKFSYQNYGIKDRTEYTKKILEIVEWEKRYADSEHD